MTITDWLGHEIKVGTHIVYPTRVGSRTDLAYAVVTEVLPDAIKARRIQDTARFRKLGQIVTIHRVDRVTALD